MLESHMSDWPLWFRLAIAILATWRVAHLIAHEDGPFDMIVRLRARAGEGVLGQLMDCPYCLSIWVAMPFATLLAGSLPAWGAACLAISGGASLIERLLERPTQPLFDARLKTEDDGHSPFISGPQAGKNESLL
jgi:hypothetical protein